MNHIFQNADLARTGEAGSIEDLNQEHNNNKNILKGREGKPRALKI